MSEKFTPGPWRVEYGTTLVWGNCDSEDQSSSGMGYPVAEARITPAGSWTKRPDVIEGDANAHLIAAAPELYEALKAARFYLSHTYGDDTLSNIDAVLSKARGET